MGQTTKEKVEVTKNKYEGKLDPRGYCWFHGNKVIEIHTRKTCINRKQFRQETDIKTNTMGCSTENVGWKPSE